MEKTVYIKVTGKVQGIGFRWSAYEKFVELGLTGKAENSKDGGVEITATGEVDKLKELLRWAQKGPQGAKVNNMEYKTVEAENASPEESTKEN
ncbi:MAG: acylphosphatase [Candidatus Doudnabacteria bacterium]|nr:acylphosphatase [Candidatus Doudnabacteria bacterium]